MIRTIFSKKRRIHPRLKKQLKSVYGEDVPRDSTFRKLLDHIDETYSHQSESADEKDSKIVEAFGVSHEVIEHGKNDELLESALQHVSEAVIITTNLEIIEGKSSIVYANQAFLDLTGFAREEVCGIDPRAFVGATVDRSVHKKLRKGFREDKAFSCRLALNCKSASDYVMEGTFNPLKDRYGVVTHWAHVLRDTSEQDMVVRALHESEQRYRAVIDNIREVVFQTDSEGNWIFLNPMWKEITGFTVNETLGKNFLDYVHPDDRALNEILIQPLRQGKTDSFRNEFRYKKKSGGYCWIEVFARLAIDSSGETVGLSGTLNDVTERKNSEQKLRNSEEKFRVMFVTSPVGMVLTEVDGTFVDANQAFLNIIGYRAVETENLSIGQITPPEFMEHDQKQFQQMEVDGRYAPSQKEYLHKNGKRIPVLTSGMLVKGSDGRRQIWTFVEDITERKIVEEERQKAMEAAEDANRAKSDFLATMSHEIRTPMNGIIGMTGLLMDTDLDSDQRKFAETVRVSSENLLTIINEILDFSKIESGQLQLEEHPFDLNTCIEDALDLLAPTASAKKLDLGYLMGDNIPQMVVGDVTRLRQVIVNLIGNAIKFTHEGEVIVEVTRIPDPTIQSGDGGYEPIKLRIAVKDTGIGIPKDKINRLFQPFSQVDASTTRQFGGTGLGLAICKKLTGVMGGKIWVESEEGKGSRFIFTTQLGVCEPTDSIREEKPLSALSGKRVLVVDDSKTNRKILRIQMERLGMSVFEAEDGEKALELVKGGEKYDFGFIDFQMPIMNGIVLSEEIRKIRSEKEMTLIFLPSVSRTEEEIRTARVNFQAVMPKPIHCSQIPNVLVSLLSAKDNKDKQDVVASPAVVDPKMSEQFPLRILLAEDHMVNQKVALRVLKKMGYNADVANNGREALEALERQDYDVVLMDVQMPELDGLEATQEIIKRWDEDVRPVIVAMTANAMPEDEERCLAAGMNLYLSKPIRISALQDALMEAHDLKK
ncbi:MAG: PAS domain S-box protein [Opitutaceae bacterium]|nr:PAS domain S-box protein [Opitutaceae bacterium]